MPTDEQVLKFIAERLGWTELEVIGGELIGLRCKGDSHRYPVPNWPGDRNASYELPVEDDIDYERIEDHAENIYGYESRPRSARFESLTWILYKGYRWVECENEHCDKGEVLEGDVERTCAVCSGEGGEWRKVK